MHALHHSESNSTRQNPLLYVTNPVRCIGSMYFRCTARRPEGRGGVIATSKNINATRPCVIKSVRWRLGGGSHASLLDIILLFPPSAASNRACCEETRKMHLFRTIECLLLVWPVHANGRAGRPNDMRGARSPSTTV